MSRSHEPEPLVGKREVSEFLGGIPVSTLGQWTYRGIGPPSYRVGRYRRYRLSEVAAWVDSQTHDPRPAA